MEEGGRGKTRDFGSATQPRWCPGCGNSAILHSIQRLLPEMGSPPERYVFVSGIGCSSRFPYYIDTYGFHGLHGRAPAIATGIKLANPGLNVWVITGDGDALGIGGNHFIHMLRRNLDIVVLLFNNRIYGLTKGQTSPTTGMGVPTKSAPEGSIDYPFNPIALALGAGGSFVARVLYNDLDMMTRVLRAAIAHKGTSFVEIYDNCKIFADEAFVHLTEKEHRYENQLHIAHGRPLLFGESREKGIAFTKLIPTICSGDRSDDIIVYDETNLQMAQAIASLTHPAFPVPMGIFYRTERKCYEEFFHPEDRALAFDVSPAKDADVALDAIYRADETWEVK